MLGFTACIPARCLPKISMPPITSNPAKVIPASAAAWGNTSLAGAWAGELHGVKWARRLPQFFTRERVGG